MIAFGEIATIMIKGILQYFDLLVTGDTFIQNVIEQVSRAPPETADFLPSFEFLGNSGRPPLQDDLHRIHGWYYSKIRESFRQSGILVVDHSRYFWPSSHSITIRLVAVIFIPLLLLG
jgi:hypothetical protein